MTTPNTKIAETTDPAVVSIKGFDADFRCRGTQFEVGKTYTAEGTIKACSNGFHAVDASNPFHVWDFYPVVGDDGRLARYAEVSQSGDLDREESGAGTKIASARLAVNVELSLPEFLRRAVNAVVAMTKGKADEATGYGARIGSTGDYARIGSTGYGARIGSSGDGARIGSTGDGARIGSTGDDARIGSTGYDARIGSTGYGARIGSTGDDARIGSTGYGARIGSSGDDARIGSSGDYARIGSTGDDARIGSSGYGARIGSSGDCARIDASGQNAVVASAGRYTTFSGVDGAWVSLAEYDGNGRCVGFATGCIGRDGLEAGVAYRARGGKLVEA